MRPVCIIFEQRVHKYAKTDLSTKREKLYSHLIITIDYILTVTDQKDPAILQ